MASEEAIAQLAPQSFSPAPVSRYAELERSIRSRSRRKRLLILFILLAPVLATILYAFFIAKPMYTAEARFAVRGGMTSTASSSPPTSILSSGMSGGLIGGFVDGFAVHDFLSSRDAMHRLDAAINLRKYLTQPGLDPFERLPKDASDDQLFNAYTADVKVRFDMIEQIVVVDVQAFSAAGAVAISDGVLKITDQFVNNLNQRGVDEAVKTARIGLDQAERESLTAHAALAKWRNSTRNVDPTADTTMLITLIGQLESQLASAQANLAQINAFHNPHHPQLEPAELLVASLKHSIDDARSRLGGAGPSEATHLATYDALKTTESFADSNVTLARQTYEQARLAALSQQRYLAIIAQPTIDETVTYPNVAILIAESLAASIALVFFGSIAFGLARGFMQF